MMFYIADGSSTSVCRDGKGGTSFHYVSKSHKFPKLSVFGVVRFWCSAIIKDILALKKNSVPKGTFLKRKSSE